MCREQQANDAEARLRAKRIEHVRIAGDIPLDFFELHSGQPITLLPRRTGPRETLPQILLLVMIVSQPLCQPKEALGRLPVRRVSPPLFLHPMKVLFERVSCLCIEVDNMAFPPNLQIAVKLCQCPACIISRHPPFPETNAVCGCRRSTPTASREPRRGRLQPSPEPLPNQDRTGRSPSPQQVQRSCWRRSALPERQQRDGP